MRLGQRSARCGRLEGNGKESDGAGSSSGEVVGELGLDIGEEAGLGGGNGLDRGQRLATGSLGCLLGRSSSNTLGLGLANARIEVELCCRTGNDWNIFNQMLKDWAGRETN